MSAEIFALVTAFLRGFSTIPTRRGLQTSNARSSAIVYLLVNTTFLWVMTFILYPLDQITTRGLEYFVLAGIFAPGIARMFRDVSIKRLGVAMTSPIVATNTLFGYFCDPLSPRTCDPFPHLWCSPSCRRCERLVLSKRIKRVETKGSHLSTYGRSPVCCFNQYPESGFTNK